MDLMVGKGCINKNRIYLKPTLILRGIILFVSTFELRTSRIFSLLQRNKTEKSVVF